MRGRKSTGSRPTLGKGLDGRMSPANKTTEQGSVPAKQQLGFEVPGPSQAPRGPESDDQKRMLFANPASIGSQAELMLKSGESLGGTIVSTKSGPDGNYVLGDVRKGSQNDSTGSHASQQSRGRTVLPTTEVASLTLKEADVGRRMPPATDAPTGAGFNTDADISRNNRQGLVNRELVPWMPDDDGKSLEGLTLNSTQAGKLGRWDQFAANKAQFGVQTTFDEDIYTTKLDKSKAGISEKEAARIAREIEGRKTNNPHQAEERGQIQYREMNEDEEARYSSVARGAKDPTDSSFDTRNDETFGSVTPKEPTKPWSGAANSVAAITGRPSSAGKTAPIDMDPRKEHNKVRMQLAGGNSNKDRSPYGTPKGGRSPLLSPLVGNAAQVEALDLNVDTGIKYDPGVRSEFRKFKQAFKQGSLSPSNDSELAKMASADSPPEDSTATSGAQADNSRQGLQTGAREQSGSHMQDEAARAMPQNLRKPLMSFTPTGSQTLPDQAGKKFLPENAANAKFNFGSISTPPGSSGVAHAPKQASKTTAATGSQSSIVEQQTAPQANAAVPLASLEGRPSTAPAFKLNPKAKEFKFNPSAASFTPGALSRAGSGASSINPQSSTPALSEAGIPRPGPVAGKQPGMTRAGSSGRIPLGGLRAPTGLPGRGGARMNREGPAGRHPGSPKPSRFDRRELQSARPHSQAGGMHRPMMPLEGGAMAHSQMLQQQQQQQMMANGGMTGGHMPHLGPPQVPPYEMNPARPHFSPGHTYPMMPGSPMFASSPYQQGPHPMMMSPPPNQQPGMYPQQGYPMGVMYPGHAMGMMIPHYEGGNGH